MAFLATPLLIYFAYETILMKNFISVSDVKETEKLKKKIICLILNPMLNIFFSRTNVIFAAKHHYDM
jgi:hypothetical protein